MLRANLSPSSFDVAYCWSAEFDIAASDWTPIDFVSRLIVSYARRIYESDRNRHASNLAFSSSQ